MGAIDASEMFDTYGESLYTIRGFVVPNHSQKDTSGLPYTTLEKLRDQSDLFRISIQVFDIKYYALYLIRTSSKILLQNYHPMIWYYLQSTTTIY